MHVVALLLSCSLGLYQSISNRSGIILASRTHSHIMSNRLAKHESDDQMSLNKDNVLFISIASGPIHLVQPINIIM